MKNIISKSLIVLVAVAIFSFAMANSVKAATPDCIISNFKANGKTSLTVSSGNSVILSWNTIDCKSVSIMGHGINTNVTQNGSIILNPTVSSDFKITASNGYFPFQNQTVEVSVIPSPTQVQAPVTTNMVLPTQYNYYPTQSAAVNSTSKTSTTSTTSNTSTNTNGTDNNQGASAYNGITALSVRGSGSFMPSSIWQWMLVVVLILAIIVIARTLVKKPTVAQETHIAHTH